MKVQIAPILAQPLGRPAGVSARDAAQPTIDRNPLRVLLVIESSGAGTGRHVLDLAERQQSVNQFPKHYMPSIQILRFC